MTCIFNTHYPAHALQRAGKSLILSKGGSYVFGDTAEVVNEENIQKAFGVQAVIGEIETKEQTLLDVLPLRIQTEEAKESEDPEQRCIAAVTIISDSNEMSDKINGLLHQYSDLMIGRMGMPYKECGLYIINITLDGRQKEIKNLSHKLSLLPNVSVKTTFAKGDLGKEEKQ